MTDFLWVDGINDGGLSRGLVLDEVHVVILQGWQDADPHGSQRLHARAGMCRLCSRHLYSWRESAHASGKERRACVWCKRSCSTGKPERGSSPMLGFGGRRR